MFLATFDRCDYTRLNWRYRRRWKEMLSFTLLLPLPPYPSPLPFPSHSPPPSLPPPLRISLPRVFACKSNLSESQRQQLLLSNFFLVFLWFMCVESNREDGPEPFLNCFFYVFICIYVFFFFYFFFLLRIYLLLIEPFWNLFFCLGHR